MYFIIGGDGKQYGPISEADVCKWIAEGRLNGQSQARAESETEFRMLATFPEFAASLGISSAQPDEMAPLAPVDWGSRDYDLDIGGCVSSGWNLTTSHFGQLFLPVLIYFLISMAMNLLGKIPLIGLLFSLGTLFINGPLFAGVLYIFILTIREQPAGVEKMFDGFRRGYWHLFLGYLVQGLFYLLCMLPFIIACWIKLGPAMSQLHNPNPDEMQNNLPAIMSAFVGCLPIFFICLIPFIYLTVNWQFTLPLIIDRQMGFWTAMKTSWKMVHKHWFAVFGLLVVIGLINLVGLVVCCVGMLFTIPVGFAALMYGYETIFGESRTT